MSTDIHLDNSNISNTKINWLDGNCYRVLTDYSKETHSKPSKQRKQELAPYCDNEEIDAMQENTEKLSPTALPLDIEVTANGRFKTAIAVPSYFFGFIIGAKGSKRRRIEEETETTIKIPNSNDKKIIVTGPTERNVRNGCDKIYFIVNDMRNRHALTHFVAVPMNVECMRDSFEQFKRSILNGPPIRGVDESIFQNAMRLHLTIVGLVLLEESEERLSEKILFDCNENIIKPIMKSLNGQLRVQMFGVDYMNDDPENVHVLYAKVNTLNAELPNALQLISDGIAQRFNQDGIVKQNYVDVKLHVTLMNTRYRKECLPNNQEQNRSATTIRRKSFDARSILSNFANYDFGELLIENIHICKLTEDKINYYELIGSILL